MLSIIISESKLLAEHFSQEHDTIGRVVKVTSSKVVVRFGLNAGATDLAAGPWNPDVGTHLMIPAGKYALLGQLLELSTTDRNNSHGGDSDGFSGYDGVVSLDLSLMLGSGELTPGALAKPRINEPVFLAPPELMKSVIEGTRLSAGKSDKIGLNFARLPDGTAVTFRPEEIFGRHLAIVGSSGGGKSWAIARLLEETSRFKSKVILFDATGEFYPLQSKVRHVYMGDHADSNPLATEVVLPFYQLTERDLFSIFKPTGESQAPKLRAAIQSLKLAHLEQSLAPDGTIVKANRSKAAFHSALQHHMDIIESPNAEFDIRKLTRQIENECIGYQRSAQEPGLWGDVNFGDRAQCVPLINRIQDCIRSLSLAPIFAPDHKRSLLVEIAEFMRSEETRVLRVSLRDLSFAHHARELVVNAAGRLLLDAARRSCFKTEPLLVVVDEAHQFLNKALIHEDDIYPLDSFALIAKEGRKHSLNLCLATQRPRDIPEGVLSQVGCMIVHRLISEEDQRVVERASGSLAETSIASLPGLAPGQAILVGADFPIPVRIVIDPPTDKPKSDGPDYQFYWREKE